MIQTILLKYWKQILVSSALVLSLVLVYNYVYQRGVAATTQVYEAKLKAQQDLIDKRIANIEQTSQVLAEQSKIAATSTHADLAKILQAAKNKPLVVYKNGECIPSQTFLDSWNQINLRGNQK